MLLVSNWYLRTWLELDYFISMVLVCNCSHLVEGKLAKLYIKNSQLTSSSRVLLSFKYFLFVRICIRTSHIN